MQPFTVTLFIVVPNWTQSKCLSVGEWITVPYPENGTLLSNTKEQTKDKFKDMEESKNFMSNERSLSQKSICCMIPFTRSCKKGKYSLWWKKNRTEGASVGIDRYKGA